MRITQLGIVALLTGLISLALTPHEAAAQITASCSARDEKGGEKFFCQVRSVAGENLSEVKATGEGGRALEFTSEPYSWTRNRTALYFLVQTADLNADQLRRIGQFLERAASPVGERQIGLGTVDYSFSDRAALGASGLQVDRGVQATPPASPTRAYPEMTDHMRPVIDKLAAVKADRRALILVSDGASSASAATEREIADHARSKGVLIYNLVLAKTDRPQSSLLNRISERTDGAARDLATGSNSEVVKLASDLFTLIENGSILHIEARGLPQETEITVKATTAGERQLTAPPVAVTRLTEDSFQERALSFMSRNMLVILAGLGLLIGFTMILGSVARTRWREGREAQMEDYDSDPEPAIDPNAPTEIVFKPGAQSSEPLGWLELMGADGARMPLHAGSTRIGRHRENEICLMNNSVHRRHAVVQAADDGTFSIHDLATTNGVAVNGARVSQKNLADGDIVELGEVKLRFTANANAVGTQASA